MTEIDDRIRGALDEDDRAFLDSLDDRGLFRQLGDSLGGPLGGWAKLVFVITFLLSAVMFYSVWQALHAEELREVILWAAASVALVSGIGFLKHWMFSRMNMFAVLREVKRLQVQIAILQDARD